MRAWQPQHRRARRGIKIAATLAIPALVAGGVLAFIGPGEMGRVLADDLLPESVDDGPGTTTTTTDPTVGSVVTPVRTDDPVTPGPTSPGPTSSPSPSATSGEDERPDDETDPTDPTDDSRDDDEPVTSPSPTPPSPTPSHTPTPRRPSPTPTPTPTPTRTEEPRVDPTDPPPPPDERLVRLEDDLVDATNSLRALGCPDVTVDPRLTAAARAHSADMQARDYFGHDTPDGESAADRARAAGYSGFGGENLSRGIPAAGAVALSWLLSPEPRDTMLDCDFVSVGVGVSTGPAGTLWTMMLGYE